MTISPPDIVVQRGPFLGNIETEENLTAAAVQKRGFHWIRITREGRMFMVEGWKGARPPDNPGPVPLLKGVLPDGWRENRVDYHFLLSKPPTPLRQ